MIKIIFLCDDLGQKMQNKQGGKTVKRVCVCVYTLVSNLFDEAKKN